MSFDRDDLDLLDATDEIHIETRRADGNTRRTVIWVVIDEGDVFIRSVRGDGAHWYRRALADPLVTLHAGGRSIAAHAVAAPDPESVARCTAALERKYAGDPALRSMLRPLTLPTTLRLEPT